MKKSPWRLIRKITFFGLLLFGLLAVIIAANTISFSSKQILVEPVEKIPLSNSIADPLSAAIQLPTISYVDHIDTLAFRQLDTLLKTSFPLVDSLLERIDINPFSQVFRWAGKQADIKPILLLAHLDVVPVEEAVLSRWTEAPFSGRIKDGFIWGRGAIDDKMSAFAILEAVELLLQQGYRPNRSLFLAFGHDEEVSGYEGAQSIARHFAEQHVQFEYVLDEGQIILENALDGLASPLAMIGIAEKGYLTLSLKVALKEGGHSSMPPSETAIGILSRAINQLQSNPFPARIDGATAGFFEFIGPEMDPVFKNIFANLWISKSILIDQLSAEKTSNALIRTTIAPTVIQGGVRANVLPTQAEAKINFRILPGETVSSVKTYVETVIKDERVEVTLPMDSGQQNPSKVSGTDTFGFRVLQKTIQEIFPEVVVAPALVIGATDSRHYQQVSEHIYRFQPIKLTKNDLSRFHGIDERIAVEGYLDAIRFYRQLIMNSAI